MVLYIKHDAKKCVAEFMQQFQTYVRAHSGPQVPNGTKFKILLSFSELIDGRTRLFFGP